MMCLGRCSDWIQLLRLYIMHLTSYRTKYELKTKLSFSVEMWLFFSSRLSMTLCKSWFISFKKYLNIYLFRCTRSYSHMGSSIFIVASVLFGSVAQSCPSLLNPMNCSTPGFPVRHQLLEFTQTRICWVGDAIQPSHPLSPPSPPAFNLSQHQGLFQWVSSSHQVVKILEFQLQHQTFQWTLRTGLL